MLAAVLYRGLIPAGLMPASGAAAAHGAVLMICPHGDMVMPASHDHGGKGPGSGSIEQCPFGAAAGPAAPSLRFAPNFGTGSASNLPDRNIAVAPGSSPRLQPPARGPPIVS